MMEKHLVHRIPSTEFDSQFTKLRMDTTERGYMKIHHETEDARDDVCDTVAGLVYLTSGYNIQSGGLTVIDSKGKIYSSKDSDVIRGMKDDHAKDVKDKQVIGTGIQTLKQYLRNQRLNGY